MQVIELRDVRILGVGSCLPTQAVDNLAACERLYGSAEKAASVVRTTGVRSRRVAAPGMTSLDLCVGAAERLLAESGTAPDEIGAVIQVTFTPARQMPCNACQAQARLGIPQDVVAFDVGLACSGWTYGLYLAGLLAQSTGRKVLLLDGDVQTDRLDGNDAATVPLLADAGSAALLAPAATDRPWKFAFFSDGAQGEALTLPVGGPLAMDGFGVFRFVTTDALHFIRDFMSAAGEPADRLDAFVPHQANVFMIRQMAKSLGFADGQLQVSADVFGNSASATVPVTLAHGRPHGRVLVAGFGGGLSVGVGAIDVPADCVYASCELAGGGAARAAE